MDMSHGRISPLPASVPTETSSFIAPPGRADRVRNLGEGPPLVLIHGTFSDQRTNWMYVKPLLAPHVTGFAMARRGRGGSDATMGHAVADEIADAVALIRHIGAPVDLLGHSYGAPVALGAAAEAPDLVRKLVVYEPPRPDRFDADAADSLARLAEAGDWQGFAMRFFGDVLLVPQADIAAMQGTEDWDNIIADAPASLGDLRAITRHRFDPDGYRGLAMPVLLQTGTESPPDLFLTDALAMVLPAASIGVLAGQAHEGMTTAPEQYAQAVLDFLRT